MKKFTSKTQKTGEIGEKLAEKKLLKLGFKIIERNYTKQAGEIDIVAKKAGKFHFVEVKAVSCDLFAEAGNLDSVSRSTYEGYRPEENLTFHKFLKIARTVDLYLIEKNVPHETLWQIDLACVYVDLAKKQGKVEILENIII